MHIKAINTDNSSILIAGVVHILYNPAFDAYCIGPQANLPGGYTFRILTSVGCGDTPYVFPVQSTWAPLSLMASDVGATPTAAASTTAVMDTPQVFPVQPAWAPPSPTTSDVAATVAVASPNTAPVDTTKAPKSPNSFMLFRSDEFAKYCAEHPNSPKMQAKDFCKYIGQHNTST
jgi:hypothetical protein